MAYRPTAGLSRIASAIRGWMREGGAGRGGAVANWNWGPLSWRTCAQYVIFVSNDLHTGAGDSTYRILGEISSPISIPIPIQMRVRPSQARFGQSQQF